MHRRRTARVAVAVAPRELAQLLGRRSEGSTVDDVDLSALRVELLVIWASQSDTSNKKKTAETYGGQAVQSNSLEADEIVPFTMGYESAMKSKRLSCKSNNSPDGTDLGIVVVQLLLSAIILPSAQLPPPWVPLSSPA